MWQIVFSRFCSAFFMNFPRAFRVPRFSELNIYSIASGLEDRGWLVGKDSFPFKAIRFMQSPGHAPYIDDYLRDLEHVSRLVKEGKISDKVETANYN